MQGSSITKDYAIILAGGKSSRMGQDKALLKIGHETLLQYVCRVVYPLVAQSIVMLSNVQKMPEDLKGQIIFGRDSQNEQGPLQGISDAMNLLPSEGRFVYVLSCDLPYLTTQWLSGLKQTLLDSESTDIVCSSSKGYQNPLIAIYRYSVIKKSGTLINKGKRSCLALLDNQKVIRKEPKSLDSKVVDNVNTPDEYANALEKLQLSDSVNEEIQ